MITRREFVAGCGCCAAIAGTLLGQDADAPKNVFDASKNEKLVSPCGTYCGACFAYIATQEDNPERLASGFGTGGGFKPTSLTNMQCDGCRGGGRVLSHVPKCAIRECAATKTKTGRCSECEEFPCSRLTEFSGDGMLHRALVMENLRQLRAVGIKDWAQQEYDRWACPKCGGRIAWYDPECPKCKAPRSDKLFPLKKA